MSICQFASLNRKQLLLVCSVRCTRPICFKSADALWSADELHDMFCNFIKQNHRDTVQMIFRDIARVGAVGGIFNSVFN